MRAALALLSAALLAAAIPARAAPDAFPASSPAETAPREQDAAPGVAAPSALCERAIIAAAPRRGVPEMLLRAVALVESGRAGEGGRRPWPWTVNMEGESRWFENRADAERFVAARRAAGARSFDIGCMQLNHRWHGQAFASAAAMFDPDANVDYAARHLAELMRETGDWMRAAGYYHSRTPRHFRRYSDLVADAYDRLRVRDRTPEPLRRLPEPPPPPALTPAPPSEPAPGRWSGLLRLASAPLRAAPEAAPEARPDITAGAVAQSGFGAAGRSLLRTPGRPLLRPARPLF